MCMISPASKALIGCLFFQQGETVINGHNIRSIRIAEQIRDVWKFTGLNQTHTGCFVSFAVFGHVESCKLL